MNKALILFGIVATASSGFAVAYARDKVPAPEVRAVGKPVSCVTTYQIRSTKVVDDRTIDFKMAGGKTYRNRMDYSCPGLKFEDKFLYKTSTSQLCSVDIIHVLHNYGGRLEQGAGCGLGKFQPVEKVASR
ncbi:MAG: hypothetical protein ABI668_05605 [Sphingorhabdus sp.]